MRYPICQDARVFIEQRYLTVEEKKDLEFEDETKKDFDFVFLVK